MSSTRTRRMLTQEEILERAKTGVKIQAATCRRPGCERLYFRLARGRPRKYCDECKVELENMSSTERNKVIGRTPRSPLAPDSDGGMTQCYRRNGCADPARYSCKNCSFVVRRCTEHGGWTALRAEMAKHRAEVHGRERWQRKRQRETLWRCKLCDPRFPSLPCGGLVTHEKRAEHLREYHGEERVSLALAFEVVKKVVSDVA